MRDPFHIARGPALERARAAGTLVALLSVVAAHAAAPQTALTIYSSAQPGAIPSELYRPGGVEMPANVPGYATVRQDRDVEIARGRSILKFTDVAALIDPTTVTFASLTDPHTRVIEQNFQFDLVSTGKLLLKFVDRPITVEQSVGDRSAVISGTLMSAHNGLVLRDKDGALHALNSYSSVTFPSLPEGLITRPTLIWDVQSAQAGMQRTRVTYQTSGMTWWADYNGTLSEGRDPNKALLDLSAWVSIVNLSGASYEDARLKLIAGDVNRVGGGRIERRVAPSAVLAQAEMAPGFEEKAFAELHLYTLGRSTTLPNDSTKQLELFPEVHQIPVRRLLVYTGGVGAAFPVGSPVTGRDLGPSNKRVEALIELTNDARAGLGMPLPAGRIRISKIDTADGNAELIGEDRIDHTPKDEKVRVRLGTAFDVVGERHQVDFQLDSHARWMEEEIEVRLRNHKEQAVEVQVREFLHRWSNWKILSASPAYEKEDASTIDFHVDVPANGEATARYRVRYSW